MNLTFQNGGDREQSLWQEGLARLLNYPFDDIPASMAVSFVDIGEVAGGHNDLAATDWSYGSVFGDTRVREDAPSFGTQKEAMKALAAKFGVQFAVEPFYMETAVHELAHILYGGLAEQARVEIAQMFGADSDSLDEIQPSGTAWENHVIEGIAETFKEAFLPRRFRVFPNRSNKRIPYRDFPRFRHLFRNTKTSRTFPMPGGGGANLPEGTDAWRYGAVEQVTARGLDVNESEGGGSGDWLSFAIWGGNPQSPTYGFNALPPGFHFAWEMARANGLDYILVTHQFDLADEIFSCNHLIGDPSLANPPLSSPPAFSPALRVTASRGSVTTEPFDSEWSGSPLDVVIPERFPLLADTRITLSANGSLKLDAVAGPNVFGPTFDVRSTIIASRFDHNMGKVAAAVLAMLRGTDVSIEPPSPRSQTGGHARAGRRHGHVSGRSG